VKASRPPHASNSGTNEQDFWLAVVQNVLRVACWQSTLLFDFVFLKKIVEVGRGKWSGRAEKDGVMDGVEAALYFAMSVGAITIVAALWALLRWR
jgi:hypothetical protein